MYKIGEFSKICTLSVKALRYYDEENILSPSYRDDQNGYRYYDEHDYERALMIKMLRDMTFSIAEIKEIMGNVEERKDLAVYLQEKQSMIEQQMQKERQILKNLSDYVNQIMHEEETTETAPSIEIISIEEQLVASIRSISHYGDTGVAIAKICKEAKANIHGVPFAMYHDDEYKEEADIEICIPIRKEFDSDIVTIRRLPMIKGISIEHIGPYDTLHNSYKRIFDYASENNMICLTPSREYYIKGPGRIFQGNPEKYVTKIIVPIKIG